MKKYLFILLAMALMVPAVSAQKSFTRKNGKASQKVEQKAAITTATEGKKKTKKVASATTAKVATKPYFIVISKKDLNLRVYKAENGDTTLVQQFDACLSKNLGNKQRKGDMRTPESPAGKPFKITQIQDASTWRHDFNDGRGNIKAYGHWFLRLLTPGHNGIGIHGSTNNESSVPGRASEGCIRLRDADIITLKEKYAYVGMPVIIKAEGQGLLPFETE